jgi:rod shape-determining protein MreC
MSPSRSAAIFFSLLISLALLGLGAIGVLAPAESGASYPLNLLQETFGGASNQASSFSQEWAEVQTLRERNRELERSLTQFQSEVAELRVYRADYERLADLANYVGEVGTEWQYVTADVIGRDVNGLVRTIHINAGTRDGVVIGDPVVTPLGLLGRVIQTTATGAEVLLISDQNSAVNARALNEARDQGLVRGSLSGELIFDFLDINAQLEAGQQVYTSGETQSFPPNLLLGQVTSIRISADELFQQAILRSLVDFDSLQLVLVITNWEPVDLEAFEATPEP